MTTTTRAAASRKMLWDEYVSSVKELKTKQARHVFLLEAAFYAVVLLVSFIAGALGGRLQQSLSSSLVSLQDGGAVWVLWKLVATLLFFFLAILAAWSISRSLIWAVLMSKPVTKQYIWKCSLLSALWLIAWFTPIALLFRATNDSIRESMTVQPGLPWLVYALLTLWFYFTYPVYVEFCSSGKLFRSIGSAFVKGVKHVPQLIIPFIMMVVTVFVIGRISLLAGYLPSFLNAIAASVLFFGTFAWAKLYYRSVLGRVLHHEHHH